MVMQGSIKIMGAYDPHKQKPQMMTSEMARRVEARRLAEQGKNKVVIQEENK